MPTQDAPDLICIVVTHEEDVFANAAEVRVTVEGTSLFTGRAALTKSKEVGALVQELTRVGIGESAIALESVSASVSSGILGRSSSARYELRITVSELELLPDVLGVVTGAKQSSLGEIVWRYPDGAEAEAAWLTRCVAQANRKAASAAAALGARIVAVHRLREAKISDPSAFPAQAYAMAPGGYGAGPARARVEMGFPLTHKKRDGLRVEVEYRIEGGGAVTQP